VAAGLLLDLRRDRLVEVRHHPREQLDDHDLAAVGDQGLGHLEPDVAGADDQRAADLLRVEQVAQRDRVLEPPDREHVVVTGHRQPHRRAASGHDQAVVADLEVRAGLPVPHDALLGVDPGGLGAEPQVEPAPVAEEVRRVREQGLGLLDDPGDVVGDAAQPVRGVAAALEHDDPELRVDAPRRGGRGHARGAAADDDQPAGHLRELWGEPAQ
jgi:hypothetical protein